jgi:hypothetical protein
MNLKNLLSTLKKIKSSLSTNWVLISSYTSQDKTYAHEHYICYEKKLHKHIVRHWNKKPIIKITKQSYDK